MSTSALRGDPPSRLCYWAVHTQAIPRPETLRSKNVGVREFRDRATHYLSGADKVDVSKHGRVVGFYVLLDRDEDEVRRAIAKLSETVGRVVVESGLTEDELVALIRRQHAQ